MSCSVEYQVLEHIKLEEGRTRILQLTDLHHFHSGYKSFQVFNNVEIDAVDAQQYSFDGDVKLLQNIISRNRPDLVILTGDIIEGRSFSKGMVNIDEELLSCFKEVVQPLIDAKIPWTFTPGNHDDDHNQIDRDALLKIFMLPYCVSNKAKGFNHTFTIGPSDDGTSAKDIRVYLFDTGGNNPDPEIRYDPVNPVVVSNFKQVAASLKIPNQTQLAYFHIPLVEYGNIQPVKGSNGLFTAALNANKVPFPWNYVPWLVRLIGKDLIVGSSKVNTGLFEALQQQGILATFCGHDHQSDAIMLRDGVFLCYGRCGSVTPPSDWETTAGQFPFPKGCRVVEYDHESKVETYIEVLDQEEPNSRFVFEITHTA